MAPKRSAPPPPPPAASDEETASGSGSEEESEEEEEIAYSPPPAAPKTMAPPPHAAPKTMAPPPQKGQESEDDEEDDDEEEDDEEEEENTQVPPPLATKNPSPPPPNREESESSGEDEEEEEEENTQVPPPLATKNPSPPPPNREESESSGEDDDDEETDDEAPQPKPAPKQVAKGGAAKPPLNEDKKAGAPFQRIWSADDEVRILEAMAKHRREHGTLPQVEALATMLDGTLDNSDRSVVSLQGKLRNMKRRYSSAANKGELPSKEHDRRVFDLSKAVWGSMTAVANGGTRRGREVAEMRKLYPCIAEEVMAVEKEHPGLFKREFGMIDDDKARALERKIKKHRLHQAKLNVRRADVMKEVTKTLIDLSQEHHI